MNPKPISIGATPRGEARAPRMLTPKHHVRIFELASGLLLGHTGDLSTGGMRVVSDRPIPTGQTFRVWTEIQAPRGHRTRTLLDVQSVWTKCSVEKDAYETGFRITDATPEAAKSIQALTNKLCVSR